VNCRPLAQLPRVSVGVEEPRQSLHQTALARRRINVEETPSRENGHGRAASFHALAAAGLTLTEAGGRMMVEDVAVDSPAKAAGIDWDQQTLRVLCPVEQPSKHLTHIPALPVLALIVVLQRRRIDAVHGREAAA